MYQIRDFFTKKPVFPDNLVFVGDDSPWEVQIDLHKLRATIDFESYKHTSPSLLKYLLLLPLKKPALDLFSMSQNATPLLKSHFLGQQYGINLFFKVEGKNPTGSFKDRGSALEVAVARELGAKAVVLASTGNMAASCACYAAIAQMPCFVLVNEEVPAAKLAQSIAFGAHVLKVRGVFNDAALLAKEVAKKIGLYLAGDYAFRVEGQKTAIFEIIDQLADLRPSLPAPLPLMGEEGSVPDIVIVPMGCGTNIGAYAKGLHEYHELGLIDRIPQLVGVQAEGADAIIRSYQQNMEDVTSLSSVDTIASAIAVPCPIDGVKALDAIKSTHGLAIAVTDAEILEAKYELSSKEGLFVESASATTLAALKKLVEKEKWRNKKIVCVLTGDGLKDPQVVLQCMPSPPVIDPEVDAFLSFYRGIIP